VLKDFERTQNGGDSEFGCVSHFANRMLQLRIAEYSPLEIGKDGKAIRSHAGQENVKYVIAQTTERGFDSIPRLDLHVI
jgi:hypothetical protein